MSLSTTSFAFVADLVRRETAMLYPPGKEYLVEARLQPLALEAGCASLDAYVVRLHDDVEEQRRAVDALTINETSWFRDNKPFISLATAILPELVSRESDTRHLTLWSAACSSGQEAYSMAMVLDEHLPADWTAEIWATDVSRTMVARVGQGRYSQVEMNRGLPATSLVKYFTRVGSEWQVADHLRAMVRPDTVNLVAPLPPMPRFDVVFLRNVLIYFDDETREAVVDSVRDVVAPDGYLVVGSSETALDLGERWEREECGRISLHRPAPRPAAATPSLAARRRSRFDDETFLMTGA